MMMFFVPSQKFWGVRLAGFPRRDKGWWEAEHNTPTITVAMNALFAGFFYRFLHGVAGTMIL